ncbi:MAG: DUF1844 domain-containing protein [Candidatus Geothermincolia bacterium]
MGDEREEDKAKSSKLWTPGGEPVREEPPEPAGGEGEELTEEELRQRIEEVMEKITVADIVLDMMISLTSLAFQRMGIPSEVNEKFKDMEQARLAIDCLDALAKVLDGQVSAEQIEPLKGAIANLKLNFAKES